MKKAIFILLMMLYSSTSVFSQAESMHITGTFTGYPDSTQLNFFYSEGNIASKVDSTYIIDGKVDFTYHLDESPNEVLLALSDFSSYIKFWAENTEIQIVGDKSDFKKSKIIGSPLQTVKQALKDENNRKNKLSLIKQNLDKQPAIGELYWLVYGKKIPIDTVEAFYKLIPEDMRSYDFARKLNNMILASDMPELKVGSKYIDFDAFDPENNNYKLSELLDRHVLIEFGSSACGPCIMAIPEMRDIHNQYGDKIRILSFSMDSREKSWRDGIKRMKEMKGEMPWLHLWDGEGDYGLVNAQYKVEGLPTFYLISPEGDIVEKWMGYKEGLVKEKLEEFVLAQ